MEYAWMEDGTYDIRVQVKDEHGLESDWSESLSVSMPKNKPYFDIPFYELLENPPRTLLKSHSPLSFLNVF